jgi:hypothetical protein
MEGKKEKTQSDEKKNANDSRVIGALMPRFRGDLEEGRGTGLLGRPSKSYRSYSHVRLHGRRGCDVRTYGRTTAAAAAVAKVKEQYFTLCFHKILLLFT